MSFNPLFAASATLGTATPGSDVRPPSAAKKYRTNEATWTPFGDSTRDPSDDPGTCLAQNMLMRVESVSTEPELRDDVTPGQIMEGVRRVQTQLERLAGAGSSDAHAFEASIAKRLRVTDPAPTKAAALAARRIDMLQSIRSCVDEFATQASDRVVVRTNHTGMVVIEVLDRINTTERAARRAIDRVLAAQGRDEDLAGETAFAVVRESLDASDATALKRLLREATARTAEFKSPRLLVNLLMATFGARHTLGAARLAFIDAARTRLAALVGAERAQNLVDRLA